MMQELILNQHQQLLKQHHHQQRKQIIQHQRLQILVRFENRTYNICLSIVIDEEDESCSIFHSLQKQPQKEGTQQEQEWIDIIRSYVLNEISDITGWPIRYLHFTNFNYDDLKWNNKNLCIHSTNIIRKVDNAVNDDVTSIVVCDCNVFVINHCIIGGKGGFGTLLKGQSRQVGANITTDFTSCRDLQGRRLQHINDTIQYNTMNEWYNKINNGIATYDDMIEALLLQNNNSNSQQNNNANTGILGWNLQLPSWADVSMKNEMRRNTRALYQWRRQNKKEVEQRQYITEIKQKHIDSYVNVTDNIIERSLNQMYNAIQNGKRKQTQQLLLEKQKVIDLKRKRQIELDGNVHDNNNISNSTTHTTSLESFTAEEGNNIISSNVAHAISNDNNNFNTNQQHVDNKQMIEPPTAFLTISGEFVLEYQVNASTWYFQSKANFSTIGIVLESTKLLLQQQQQQTNTNSSTNNNNIDSNEDITSNDNDDINIDNINKTISYYYEIGLITPGIIQIGWYQKQQNQNSSLIDMFQPNSDNGDGVGDCQYSWSIDYSRFIKLHNSTTEPYGDDGNNDCKRSATSDNVKENNTDSLLVDADKNNSSSSVMNSVRTVVGCLWNVSTNELFYSFNGIDAGVAFQLPKSYQTEEENKEVNVKNEHQQQVLLFPSISCNQDEIMELRVCDHQFQYKPTYLNNNKSKNHLIIPIGDVMVTSQDEEVVVDDDIENDTQHNNDVDVKQTIVSLEGNVEKTTSSVSNHVVNDLNDNSQSNNKISDKADEAQQEEETEEQLNEFVQNFSFEQYESIDDIEKIGLQRLKLVLMSMGIKCGGTLQERAKRLFTLKGLKPEDFPTQLLAKKLKK